MSVGSAMFATAVLVRNALYDRGLLPARRLAGPVVSVGNLSVGGSGKTPFVIFLGEMLKARGIKLDVLTRGYGRSTRGIALVEPAGSAREFGDEPLLIARRLGVPVIVGEDRYQAGRFAEQKFGPQLHLLDDGFQHRQLARDFDIVLLTPEDLRDRLLPAGRLREALPALHRANAVVLTAGAKLEDLPPDIRKLFSEAGLKATAEKGTAAGGGAPEGADAGRQVWQARRGIRPKDVPARPVAFCGIARPQRFFLQLRKAGVELAAEATFKDHYAYADKDIKELLWMRAQAEAGGFVTTEKDAINLGTLAQQLQPLAVVPVTMSLVEAEAAISQMLAYIEQRRGGGA